jgi:hypothetical protein
MLTGFNTDVEWEGVTYHVQTEDKGLANPIILSLIYKRGTILAARRTPYNELITEGEMVDTARLTKAIEKQHFTILAAIKAGKLEQLIKKLNSESQAARESAESDQTSTEDAVANAASAASISASISASIPGGETPATVTSESVITAADAVAEAIPAQVVSVAADIREGLEIKPAQTVAAESAAELRAEKPKASSRLREKTANLTTGNLSGSFDNFDDLFAGLLKSTDSREKIGIELHSHPRLIAGEDVTIHGSVLFDGQWPAVNAPVKGQIVGTTIRPQSFIAHADTSGNFSVTVRLPEFASGTAALILHVQDPKGQEAEIKLLIRKR